MNLATQPSPSLHRTLRYAEWALLLMMALLYAIDHYLYKIQILPDAFLKATVFIVIFFILSFAFPVERPRWQRYLYISLEITLILIAQLFWLNFDILLYFFLIKSCFLLNRRDVLLTVGLTGLGYFLTVVWTLPLLSQKFTEMIRTNTWEDLYKPQVLVAASLIQYIGISIFVVLLGFVVVAERRSRQKAETLSREIEIMAAALERSRIARDIHDSLGHSLTTLNIQLELAQAMKQRDPNHASQALDNAQKLARHCLESVRQAVQTVRQEGFQEKFDLKIALQQLIAQTRQNRAFTIDADLDLPLLPPQIGHQLYCVVQEGLTNIQKHAQASRATLRSRLGPDTLTVELQDDGQGFDLTASCTGYGLRGMQERMHLLGGQLQVASTPGNGTQIRATVPL
jgi:signal transduction histidine kinase